MVVSLFHLHVFFLCVSAALLWLNCPFASFTKWLWWVLHKCAHVNEQSEDKAGSVREKAIQTGDALNWDFDAFFFPCIISEGPPSHCVIRLPRQLHWSWIRRHLQTFLCWITSAQSNAGRQQVQTLGCIIPVHNCRSVIQTDPFFTMQPITDPDFLISLVRSPALTKISHQIIFGSFVCSSSWNDYIIIIIITIILLLYQLCCSIEIVMWYLSYNCYSSTETLSDKTLVQLTGQMHPSGPVSGRCWICFLFLKGMTFTYYSSAVDSVSHLFCFFLDLPVSSFFKTRCTT